MRALAGAPAASAAATRVWSSADEPRAALVDGAVAPASAAAADPLRPRWLIARTVEPDTELPGAGLEPPPELCPAAPPGGTWTVEEGRPPPAVGTTSTYWLTAETPGGAIVFVLP